MKRTRTRTRISALLLPAVLCALITACGAGSRPLLWYQDVLVSATVSDGTHTWRIAPIDGGFTAEIISPPEASGVTFSLTDVSASVSVEGVEIPVSDAMTSGARRLIDLFTLDETRVSDVRPDKGTQTTHARFQTDGGEISIIIGADGLPASFEASAGTYTVTSCETKAE